MAQTCGSLLLAALLAMSPAFSETAPASLTRRAVMQMSANALAARLKIEDGQGYTELYFPYDRPSDPFSFLATIWLTKDMRPASAGLCRADILDLFFGADGNPTMPADDKKWDPPSHLDFARLRMRYAQVGPALVQDDPGYRAALASTDCSRIPWPSTLSFEAATFELAQKSARLLTEALRLAQAEPSRDFKPVCWGVDAEGLCSDARAMLASVEYRMQTAVYDCPVSPYARQPRPPADCVVIDLSAHAQPDRQILEYQPYDPLAGGTEWQLRIERDEHVLNIRLSMPHEVIE